MVKILKLVPKLQPEQAEKKIHEIAIVSGNVIITDHALERMEERGFVVQDLYGILRDGYVDHDPDYDSEKQNWKYKIKKRIDTTREAGAVTAIVSDNRLVVITVEWEVY